MPPSLFRCTDGKLREISVCLEACPIKEQHAVGQRCLSRGTLEMIAEYRKYKGPESISTTMLLKYPRKAFMEIKTYYELDPQAEAWRIRGTAGHARLERYDKEALSEKEVETDLATGKLDYYDMRTETLWDRKFWGSYTFLLRKGYEKRRRMIGYYKTGAKKGQPKYDEHWIKREPKIDYETMQLNHYRMGLNKKGFFPKELGLEIHIRDGGQFTAKNLGLERNIYTMPVPIIPDTEVREFLQDRRTELLAALESNRPPPRCPDCRDNSLCRVRPICETYPE